MNSQDVDTQNLLNKAVKFIHGRIPEALLKPRVAIVCGSGLSTLGATIRGRIDLPYSSIPGFTSSTGTYRVFLKMITSRNARSCWPREYTVIWIPWHGRRCSSSSHAWSGRVLSFLVYSIARVDRQSELDLRARSYMRMRDIHCPQSLIPYGCLRDLAFRMPSVRALLYLQSNDWTPSSVTNAVGSLNSHIGVGSGTRGTFARHDK